MIESSSGYKGAEKISIDMFMDFLAIMTEPK